MLFTHSLWSSEKLNEVFRLVDRPYRLSFMDSSFGGDVGGDVAEPVRRELRIVGDPERRSEVRIVSKQDNALDQVAEAVIGNEHIFAG